MYTPPTAEILFLLDHVVGISELVDEESRELVEPIVAGAGAFAAAEFAPLNRIGDEVGARWRDGVVTMPKGFREAYRAYVEGGWGTIGGPQEHGGQGLPLPLSCAVMEVLGSANMGFSLIMMLTPAAVEALVHHGTDEQRETWLPKLVSGEWNGTMNLTEPQAGSDVGALKTRAVRAPDGSWRIKGQKIFITFGEHDLTDNIVHLVLARTPDAPGGTRGISLFLVPKYRLDASGAPGAPNDVRCVSIEHKMGIHASPTCVLAYGDDDDCHGWLVGEEQGGMRAMFTMMNNARLNVGLQGVSIAERALQGAMDYARQRIQGARAGSNSRESVAIVHHADVRRMLVRMQALTQGARALCYYAAGQTARAQAGDEDARARADLLTPLVKAWCTDVGVEVAGLGIQIHGGMGFIEETGAAQHYRDSRIAPIYEGTNGIQAADLVGRKLGLDGGAAFAALIADIGGVASLEGLAAACKRVAAELSGRGADARMAASYPFLNMLSVATAGWLMARQEDALDGGLDPDFAAMKRAAATFFLDRILPEAIGLESSALADPGALMDIPESAFATF